MAVAGQGGGRTPSLTAQLQQFLQSQQARAQQDLETQRSTQNAMDMISNFVAALEDTDRNGTRVGQPNGRGAGRGPNDSRPRMNQHQGRQPIAPYADENYLRFVQGRGLGGLRRSAADALANRARSDSSWEKRYDDQGQHIGWRETTPSGAVNDHDLGSAAVRSAQRGEQMGGIFEMLGRGGAGLRALPYVGTAIAGVEAAKEVATFASDQRARNAPWQAIYGGSNFSTGFSQRASQAGFQLGNLFSGGLGWDDSSKAFQGVSALGYSGQQRSQDLNFITKNYMSMGMSVSESLKLVTTAAKDFNESLNGIQDGLKSSSAAARANGQSAEYGRQVFTQQYTNLSQSYGGPGTAAVASALTDVTLGMGRNMQGLDLSGLYTNTVSRYTMSSGLGISQGQLQADVASGGTNAYKGADLVLQRALRPFQTQQVTALIAQYAKQYGDRLKTDPTIISNIIMPRVLRLIQPDALLASLSAYGLNVTSEQAVILLINSILATNPLTTVKANQLRSDQQKTATPDQIKSADLGSQGGLGNTPGYANNASGLNKWIADNINREDDTGDKARKLEKSLNPILDSAVKNLGGGTMVTVQTKDGAIQTDINDAVKNYPDQIAKGTATLANGQTVREALGGRYEANYKGETTTNKKRSSAGSLYTQSQSQIDKNEASKIKSQMSGKITVVPTAQLQALLKFVPDNPNIQIAVSGAATNNPPGR